MEKYQRYQWFLVYRKRKKHAIITFDVYDFYPSISEDLLLKALNYASRFTTITQQDHHIITHANNMFDVTMGSYDGVETCELIGAYMLSLIATKFKNEVGLYRDDGLAICKATPKEIEKPKQEVCQVFKSNGLKSNSPGK